MFKVQNYTFFSYSQKKSKIFYFLPSFLKESDRAFTIAKQEVQERPNNSPPPEGCSQSGVVFFCHWQKC